MCLLITTIFSCIPGIEWGKSVESNIKRSKKKNARSMRKGFVWHLMFHISNTTEMCPTNGKRDDKVIYQY